MKKFTIATFIIVLFLSASAQNNSIALIPQPVSLQKGTGSFILKNTTSIELSSPTEESKRVADFLSKKLSSVTGFPFSVKTAASSSAKTGQIRLSVINDATLQKEGYKLNVSPTSVTITANSGAGLFYGMQTLFQLMPKEINGKKIVRNINWSVPAVTITDYPRFAWRGLMFDVSRHFFTKQEVKNFIDDMVQYKYNLLHLHLTDDEGWRLEIKSLPKLTTVGAWRAKREGKWGNTKAPDPSEPKTYGGFYTHDDVREIVKYAQDRFVNILPEVDVPGHSMAAVAAYPELSCTPGTYTVRVGEDIMNWHAGGFDAIIDNTLCPANENVYGFLNKVFTEVAQLFPFQYIHMGGDECAKNFWEKSDAVKSLMQKEGLKDMHEVQSYFVKRVEKIIQSKGKRMIGWDEILEGGLAPNASVMSWRGVKGGIEAAKMNHEVVMSPTTFAYLDYAQGERTAEPPIYASLRLNQTYKFDPLPEGVDEKFILGGQANLWTEQIQNYRTVQYMVWPRGLAIAESVWSPKEKKNWGNFVGRVEAQFERMDEQQMKYSKSMYDPIITSTMEGTDVLKVQMENEVPGLDIYYSFDETNPDQFYPKYSKELTVPKDAANLKVVTYRNGKFIGRQLNLTVEELKRRAKKK
jgi:hexosaminidase